MPNCGVATRYDYSLLALWKSERYKQMAFTERPFIRVTKTKKKNSDGLIELKVSLIDSVTGNEETSLTAVSGQPDKQSFRTAFESKSGSMEPIPEGYYKLGPVEWSDSRGDYDGSWGEGLGPIWVQIDPAPGMVIARSALGFHFDENKRIAPGSAGCLVFQDLKKLKKFVGWFADKRFAPKKMVVNWGLRTVETNLEGPPETVTTTLAKPPGTGEVQAKPHIKAFISSPNHSSRNGEKIRRVIMHYTTSDNVGGTISWFQNPNSRVSAHYIIDRNGDIYQMVRDTDKAWHAYQENADSIGIEHVAKKGQKLTNHQEKASISLLRWLMAEYKISKEHVTGHRFTVANRGHTDCPGALFGGTEDGLRKWVDENLGEDPNVVLVVNGVEFKEARVIGDRSYAWIKPVAEAFSWEVIPNGTSLTLAVNGHKHHITMRNLGGRGYVATRDIASVFGLEPSWDANSRTVKIGNQG